MPRTWGEVSSSPDFQAMSAGDQEAARQQYFAQVVEPKVSVDELPAARAQFDKQTRISKMDLPAGVTPSDAGPGRGSVNPPAVVPPPDAPRRGTMRAVAPYVAGDERIVAPPPPDPNGSVLDRPATATMPDWQPSEADLIQQSKGPIQIARERAQMAAETARANAPSMTAAPAPTMVDRAVGAVGDLLHADRTIGGQAAQRATQSVGDIYLSASQVLPQTLKLASDIVQLGTGGMNAGFSQWLQHTSDAMGEQQSSKLRGEHAELTQILQDPKADAADVAKFLVGHPEYTLNAAVPSVGSMALGVGGGRIGATVAEKIAAARGAVGAELERAASKGAVTGANVSNAAMNAGDTFNQTQGDTGDKYLAAAVAAGTTAAAGHALEGGAEGAIASHATAASRPRAVLGTMAKEGAQEAIEQLGQDTGQSMGEGKPLDPNALTKSAALAGGLGAVMGAGAGTAVPVESRQQSYSDLAKSKGFLRPTQQIAESLKGFDELAASHGLSSAAVKATKARVDGMPAEQVPGFLKRAAQAFEKRGLFGKPLDDAALSMVDPKPPEEPAAPTAEAAPVGVAGTPQGSLADQAAAALAPPSTEPTTDHPTDAAAHEAATSPTHELPPPTDAQKHAGNYKLGHLRIGGVDVSVENPQGSVRAGVDPDGKPWATTMTSHYGYFGQSKAKDGDHVDTFVKPGTAPDFSGNAYVVDQVDPATGKYDEAKVMLGFGSEHEARAAYLSNYTAGWGGLGAMTALPMPAFRAWVKSGEAKKPLGDITGAGDGLGQHADAGRPDGAGPADAGASARAGDVVSSEQPVGDAAGPAGQPVPSTAPRDSAAPAAAPEAAALNVPRETPAPAFEATRNADGTVLVKGDPAAIKAALPGLRGIAGRRGVTYGRTSADKVMAALKPKTRIEQLRENAAAIDAALPPVAEGHTRLWRGNRPGEEGKNPQFTNDAAGIAIPFQQAYGGKLTYVDVPTADLPKYESHGVAAAGAEFILPKAVASQARDALAAPSTEAPARAAESGKPAAEPAQAASAPDVVWNGVGKKGMLEHAARTQIRDQAARHPGMQWSVVPAPEFGEGRFKLEGRKAEQVAEAPAPATSGGTEESEPVASASNEAVKLSRAPRDAEEGVRTHGFPAGAAEITSHHDPAVLKEHPNYAAAKAGDPAAAVALVRDLVPAADIERAAKEFGSDAIYVFPHAEEASGHNAIPAMLATRYAAETGGAVDENVAQTNRVFHTGADAMQRLIARPEFTGAVRAGGRYVLVDDVTTLGGTLAELAHHIQQGGGKVVGAVTLASASREGTMHAPQRVLNQIEGRFGNEIRNELHIDPAALTADEARYLIGFRNADELRTRIAAAEQARSDRLRAKGLQQEGSPAQGVAEPKASLDAPSASKFLTWTQAERRLKDAGYTVERNEWDAPIVKKDGVEADYRTMPADLREAWNTLSVDDPTGPPPKPIDFSVAKKIADMLAEAGLKRINVVDNLGDMPPGQRKKLESLGSDNTIRGAYFPDTDETWIVASNIRSPEEFVFVALHEAFHRGLRATLGEEATKVLRQIYATNKRVRDLTAQQMEAHGIGRDEAIEEALADLAGRGEVRSLTGWSALLRLIKNWLGKMADKLGLKMTFTDEMVADFVAGITREGARGDGPVINDRGPLASRNPPGPPRHTLRDFGPVAKTVEAIQDRYNRWKQAIDDVRKQGGTVTEANDFYKAEERYWGKVGSRIDDFKDEMQQFVKDVAADGLTLDDVATFAYAQHAKERNEYIADKRPDMADGGSGMSTADAQAHIDTARQSGAAPALERHAQTLRDWISGTRDILRDEGLIDQTEHDAWSSMFEHYVPLRGLDGKTEARRTGSGFNIRGKESKEAKGRYSEAKNIIEQVVQDRTRTLIRAGKNEVLRSFLQFVLDNPSRNLWEVNAVERKPAVTVDANGNRIIEEKDAIVSDDRTVSVKDGGREVRILVKDDRLREQLQNLHVENIGRIVGALQFVNRQLSRLYTSLSPTFTVLNGARDLGAATFGMIDEIGYLGAAKLWANLPVAIKESYAAELGHPSSDYNRYRYSGGKTGFFDFKTIDGQAKELQAMLKDAERSPVNPIRVGRKALAIIEGINGGIENATRLAAFKSAIASGKTIAEAASISKNITVNFNRKGTLSPTLGAFFLFFNPAVQGSARIIQTLQSPKALAAIGGGMTAMFALALANAGMGDDDDGVAWWDKVPDETKERNIIIMLPPGSKAGERVPKSKTGRYLKIPMPYGYNFFAVVANQAADGWRHLNDPKRGRGPVDGMMKAANAFLGAWVPVNDLGKSIDSPKSALLAGVPDALNPIGQNILNVNSFGRKMYPDDARSENLPDSARYFPGTAGTIFQRGAEALNKATGGSRYQSGLLDMTPASLENLARGYGGGPANFTLDILNAMYVRQSIKRPDLDTRRLPFIKQLYGEIDAETDRVVGQQRMDAVQKVVDPIKRAQSDGAFADVKQMLQDAGPIAALGDVLTSAHQQLGRIRKDELATIADDKMSEADKFARIQALAEQRRSVMHAFNRAYDQATDAQAKMQARPQRQPAPAAP